MSAPTDFSQSAPANLVVLDQADPVDALRFHAPPAHVISKGEIVDPMRMRALAGIA